VCGFVVILRLHEHLNSVIFRPILCSQVARVTVLYTVYSPLTKLCFEAVH